MTSHKSNNVDGALTFAPLSSGAIATSMRGASMKSLSITRWVITDLPLWVKPPGRRGYTTAKPNCSKALSASAIPRWLVLGHVVGCAKHRADRRRFAWQ
jgi:hypothetical protein